MSLIQLSPSNGDSLLINSGSFSTGKIIRTRNELVFYTDQYGNSTGYRWLGNLPHVINGNSPQTDGGISSTSWESYITENLYDKLKSENITLSGTAHLPTVEVAYGLPKGSLKVWTPGSTSSSSQYWLYSDGTVWGGVGVLGSEPDVPFTQLHLQRDIIKYNYTIPSNGTTTISIPYTFSSIEVYVNGVLQDSNSYSVSGQYIFFSSELLQGDIIQTFLNDVPISSVDYALKSDLSNYATKDNLMNFEQDISSNYGLTMIGQCSDINDMKSVEPMISGQQVYLISRVSGWEATSSGMPWGGGKFRYISNLPENLRIDDGGSIIKTNNGKFWVRDELFTGQGEIRVEWYLENAPSFLNDESDALQTAANTALLWSKYSGYNKTIRLIMPPILTISKTINIYTRGVRIDGNHGYCKVLNTGTYTLYTDLSSNVNIKNTPDNNIPPRVVINITHGSDGGVSNPAYSDQEIIKDWNLVLGNVGDDFNPINKTDNGIVAFCHWGTSTVAAAQFSIKNVSVQGFGVGYINGDNTWGGNFYECKFVGCWIPLWLINGADNTERYTLFGCVMQNGYRCVYSPWGGDFNIVKGSYVWNTGPYFEFPTASNMIEINPSRIEMVNTSNPLLIVGTAIETGATSQTFPLVKLHGSMILLDASTVQPANYLFSVSKYSKLIVEDNTWSHKNMTNNANLKLLNPSDTGGKVIFRNNTCRVGIFSEMARDSRLMTSRTPAGRINDITIGGVNAAKASYSVNGAALTFTVNETSTSGTLTLLLRVPVDVDMTDWDSLSWKAVFANLNLTGTWTINCFASVAGSSYLNNRIDLGSVTLNSVTDISDVCSNNAYGFKKILKRADGGWDRVPTEVYFYISGGNSQTAGDTFTITSLGLLGY
ncbi:tail fiber protein [Klebsiella phage Muenster]|nr:tail fiber protein [Klebsiella phage Muenster]